MLLPVIAVLLLGGQSALAQIYVTNSTAGTIGEYSLSGAPINPALVMGLNFPIGVDLYNGNLFVTNLTTASVGVYNATTGAVVNSALVTGLHSSPGGIIVADGTIYVGATFGNSFVGAFDATTGAPIWSTPVASAAGVVLSGSTLYAVENLIPNGSIGSFDAATGAIY